MVAAGTGQDLALGSGGHRDSATAAVGYRQAGHTGEVDCTCRHTVVGGQLPSQLHGHISAAAAPLDPVAWGRTMSGLRWSLAAADAETMAAVGREADHCCHRLRMTLETGDRFRDKGMRVHAHLDQVCLVQCSYIMNPEAR